MKRMPLVYVNSHLTTSNYSPREKENYIPREKEGPSQHKNIQKEGIDIYK